MATHTFWLSLRLALDEAIGTRVQGRISSDKIVEHEFATVGRDRQHRMAVAVLLLDHREQQRLPRKAFLDQHAALQQRKILAIALAVAGIVPGVGGPNDPSRRPGRCSRSRRR